MSLTTSFKESEVPAWIKERLRTWHTQLFTDLDYVDFYSPSCRQDILKRFFFLGICFLLCSSLSEVTGTCCPRSCRRMRGGNAP